MIKNDEAATQQVLSLPACRKSQSFSWPLDNYYSLVLQRRLQWQKSSKPLVRKKFAPLDYLTVAFRKTATFCLVKKELCTHFSIWLQNRSTKMWQTADERLSSLLWLSGKKFIGSDSDTSLLLSLILSPHEAGLCPKEQEAEYFFYQICVFVGVLHYIHPTVLFWKPDVHGVWTVSHTHTHTHTHRGEACVPGAVTSLNISQSSICHLEGRQRQHTVAGAAIITQLQTQGQGKGLLRRMSPQFLGAGSINQHFGLCNKIIWCLSP